MMSTIIPKDLHTKVLKMQYLRISQQIQKKQGAAYQQGYC